MLGSDGALVNVEIFNKPALQQASRRPYPPGISRGAIIEVGGVDDLDRLIVRKVTTPALKDEVCGGHDSINAAES